MFFVEKHAHQMWKIFTKKTTQNFYAFYLEKRLHKRDKMVWIFLLGDLLEHPSSMIRCIRSFGAQQSMNHGPRRWLGTTNHTMFEQIFNIKTHNCQGGNRFVHPSAFLQKMTNHNASTKQGRKDINRNNRCMIWCGNNPHLHQNGSQLKCHRSQDGRVGIAIRMKKPKSVHNSQPPLLEQQAWSQKNPALDLCSTKFTDSFYRQRNAIGKVVLVGVLVGDHEAELNYFAVSNPRCSKSAHSLK